MMAYQILDDGLSVMESGSSCSLFGGGGGGGDLWGFGGLRAFCFPRIWSGLSVLDFGIALYPSRNCSGGSIMLSYSFVEQVWVLRFSIFQFSVVELACMNL